MFAEPGPVECTPCCRPKDDLEAQARQARIEARRQRVIGRFAEKHHIDLQANVEVSSIASSADLFADRKVTEDIGEGDESKQENIAETLEKHVEQSQKNLQEILLYGHELVTNVKVAAESREKARHERLEEERKLRIEKLQHEAEESDKMYKELEQNWEINAEKTLPLELYGKIKAQQDAADELLAKKQDELEDLKQIIDDNDWEYETNLELYQKDAMLMGDRVDDLIDKLREAYVEELQLIEDYTSYDRERLLAKNDTEWAKLHHEYEELEKKTLENTQVDALSRFSRVGDMYSKIKDEAKQFKFKLEDDLRHLQLEVEHIKFATILNAEKLEYNLEVLRRRGVENMKMKNCLKRLLLKLQDRFNAKANNLKNIIDEAKRENVKIIKDIRRLEFLNDDSKRKTLHIIASSYHKFMDLWVVHEEDAKEKVKKILDIERFILETQFGVSIPEPSLEILDERPYEVYYFIHKLEIEAELEAQAAKARRDSKDEEEAKAEVGGEDEEPEGAGGPTGAALKTKTASLILEPADSFEFLPGPTPDPSIQRRLMKHITQELCAQTGFIIEDKLRRILAPMLKTEKQLCHFDTILQALGIKRISEVQTLARYLLRHCTVMKGVMTPLVSPETPILESMRVSLYGLPEETAEEMDDLHETIISRLLEDAEAAATEADNEESEDEEEERESEEESEEEHFPLGVVVPVGSEVTIVEQRPRDSGSMAGESQGSDVDRNFPKSPLAKIPEQGSTDIVQGGPIEIIAGSTTQIGDQTPLTPSAQLEMESTEIPGDESNVTMEEEYGEGFGGEGYGDMEIYGETEGYELPPLGPRCPSPPVGSDEDFKTDRAGVFSWLGREKKDKLPRMPPNSEESYEEGSDEQQEATAPAGVEADIGSTTSAGVPKSLSTVPSLPTSSAESDEFLYIEPNEILRALAEFCKDFNAKIKIEQATEEEVIASKIEKLKFPTNDDITAYWDKFLTLMEHKSSEFWDASQFCLSEYSKVLNDRNQFLEENKKLIRQNTELSQVLYQHMRENPGASKGFKEIPFCKK